jgi:hypothetical protein
MEVETNTPVLAGAALASGAGLAPARHRIARCGRRVHLFDLPANRLDSVAAEFVHPTRANRGFFGRLELHELQYAVGMEPVMEPSGSKDRSQRLAFEREAGVSTRLRSSATPIRRWP